MDRVRSVPFTLAFLESLDLVEPRAIEYVTQVVRLMEAPSEEGRPYHAYGFRDDHGPLWGWGVLPFWEGVGELWMVFDRRAGSFIFQIVREARARLERLERDFVRLQGSFPIDTPGLRRMGRLLGFEEEGILRNYGLRGEGDYIMCSRIRRCRP